MTIFKVANVIVLQCLKFLILIFCLVAILVSVFSPVYDSFLYATESPFGQIVRGFILNQFNLNFFTGLGYDQE